MRKDIIILGNKLAITEIRSHGKNGTTLIGIERECLIASGCRFLSGNSREKERREESERRFRNANTRFENAEATIFLIIDIQIEQAENILDFSLKE